MECLAGSVIPNHYTCIWLFTLLMLLQAKNMLLPFNLHRLWTCMDGTTMHRPTMIRTIFPMDILYFFWLCQNTNPSPSLDFTWYVWFSITIASLPHRQPIISVVSASRPDCQLILRHFYLVSFFVSSKFSDQIWKDLDEWKGHLQSKILKAILLISGTVLYPLPFCKLSAITLLWVLF